MSKKNEPTEPPAHAGGLAAALAEVPGNGPHLCPVASTILEMPDDDRAAVEAAIARIHEHRKVNGLKTTGGPSAGWLAKNLRAHGYKMSDMALRKHLGSNCTCRGVDK